MPNVWIVNYRNHTTYDKAIPFGTLKSVTTGKINIYKPDNLASDICTLLNEEASEDDYVLICGYAFVNALVIHYFFKRFGKSKLLIWNPQEENYFRITSYDFDVKKEVSA